MIINFFKTVQLFLVTFYYLLLSYRKNANIVGLKQQWALDFLKALNIKLRVSNVFSEKQNLIFVGNHIGFLDIIVLLAAEPRLVFLSKAEVADWPIIGPAAKRADTLFVRRDSVQSRAASKQAIHNRFKHSSASTYLAGFPSGTTSLTECGPWKKGLFEIAMTTGTMVQSFKLDYSPLRPCAYIDDDNLFGSLMKLFEIKNKTAFLEWGPALEITDMVEQMPRIQEWTRNQHELKYEKALNRSTYSFNIQ